MYLKNTYICLHTCTHIMRKWQLQCNLSIVICVEVHGVAASLRVVMEALEQKLQTLSISRRSHTQNQTYVLDVAQQSSGLLAVSCSDLTVRLHSKETLRLVAEKRGHRGPLCGVLFSHTSPHLLYSGSADGTVRVWDVREAAAPAAAAAQLFRSDPSHVYCSFDLNAGNTLLCAGTEKVDDEDSFLVFWDVRKPGAAQPLGVYSESHSDDITQVRFHPVDRNRLPPAPLTAWSTCST